MPSLFKPIVAVLCLVFALCFAAPNAHADSLTDGTINFTVTSGSPTPTGSFVFDNTTSTFTSFTVDWDGLVFDFTALANNLSATTIIGCASAGVFTFLVNDGCGINDRFFSGNFLGTPGAVFGFGRLSVFSQLVPASGTGDGAVGTFTTQTTTVATPEPSSLAFMLSGVGLVFAMRKRLSGLQQAS